MFPDPANNEVTITAEGIRKVEVRNLLGQKVATLEGDGSDSVTLGLSGLARGVYLVTVRDGEGRSTTKRLIVH